MTPPLVLVLYNHPLLPRDHPDADSEHSIVDIALRMAEILEAEGGFRTTLLGLKQDPSMLWTELRRDITERRLRIVTRLRVHLAWVARRQELLDQLPSERIVSEAAITKQGDDRVRAEIAQAIAELNALVRRHNLVVTATSLHLPTATIEGLLEIARAPHR